MVKRITAETFVALYAMTQEAGSETDFTAAEISGGVNAFAHQVIMALSRLVALGLVETGVDSYTDGLRHTTYRLSPHVADIAECDLDDFVRAALGVGL